MSAHIKLRPPDEVMRLARLGAFFPHRLSFMRRFIRRIASERAQLTIPICALDANGFGHIVLTLPLRGPLGGRAYSLIAYSRPLDAAKRTDRVIATQWDASFCLYDGAPSAADITRLADEVTRQEAGRYHHKVLTLSRANKSLRLFEHVVKNLASGKQPDPAPLKSIGYLMRTTAVYGNGKFGIADRARIAARLPDAFEVEMLTVFLIREFTLFLVDYCAAQKSARAVKLAPDYRRYLGIGNSTGLGMAPFLVNHPRLIHDWIFARETALANVRNTPKATTAQRQRFNTLLTRAQKHSAEWQVEDSIQMARIRTLREELDTLKNDLKKRPLTEKTPFNDAYQRCQNMSLETQEMMVSLLLEMDTDTDAPAPADALNDAPEHDSQQILNPAMQVGTLKNILHEHYAWVDDIDFNSKESDAQFWYTSEEKLEPRLGQRHSEPGHELEMPFNIPHYVKKLKQVLAKSDDKTSIAELLITHPDLRYMVRRAQTTAQFPYGEIRDNLVSTACRPIDLLRCKLAFFGASKFDPKSDRWTRIALFQGAPTAADLQNTPNPPDHDDWLFALFPDASIDANKEPK